MNENIDLFARLENLGDARDMVGRHPYGVRPNKARSMAVGFELRW